MPLNLTNANQKENRSKEQKNKRDFIAISLSVAFKFASPFSHF